MRLRLSCLEKGGTLSTIYRLVRHDLRLFLRNRGVLLSITALILLSIIAQGVVIVRQGRVAPEENRALIGRPDAADEDLARIFAPPRRINPVAMAHPVLDLISPERGGMMSPLEDLSVMRVLHFLLPIVGLIIGVAGQSSSKRLLLSLHALPCRPVYLIISRILSAAAVTAIMVLTLHLTTLAVFAFFPGGLHPEVLERLLYFYVIAFSYAFVFVTLGIMLDLIFPRSAAALTSGLAIVMVLVLVIPQLAIGAAITAGSPQVSDRFLPSFVSERALSAAASISHSTARYYHEIERVAFVPLEREFPIRRVLPLLVADLVMLLLWAGAASGIGIGLFTLRRRWV